MHKQLASSNKKTTTTAAYSKAQENLIRSIQKNKKNNDENEIKGKSQIRSNFTNSTHQSRVLSRQPKEIEDFLECNKNFYQGNNNHQQLDTKQHPVKEIQINAGLKDNQNLINFQQRPALFSNNSCTNTQAKYSITSSHKKQGPTSRIDKKLCPDEDTQAYNTLLTYKQDKPPSSDNSIGSSLSASPSEASSLQKHTHENQKSSKVLNPFRLNEYQTFSVPQSTQSQQNKVIMNDIKNMSSTMNKNAILSRQQPHLNNNNQSQSLQNRNNEKLVMSENKKFSNQKHMQMPLQQNAQKISSQQQQHQKVPTQLASLESKRLQNRLEKAINQDNHLYSARPSIVGVSARDQSNQKLTNTQHIAQRGINPVKTSSQNFQQALQKQGKSGMTSNISTARLKSASKISLNMAISNNINYSQIPKVQDKPQAKKLRDESDEETIDSQDMSSSLIHKENQQSKFDKFERDRKSIDGNQINKSIFGKLQSQHSNGQLFSFNEGLLTQNSHQTSLRQIQCTGQINDSNSGLLIKQSVVDSNNVLKNNANYRSTSSANKRARWDFSGGKSTLQNSFRKNSDSEMNTHPLIQKMQGNESNEKDQKYEMLQKQFLEIKKQLKEFKAMQFQDDSNRNVKLQGNDDSRSSCLVSPAKSLNYSQDPDIESQNSSEQLKLKSKKPRKVEKGSNYKGYNLTSQKQHRRKRSNSQFKSIDVQFIANNLKSSLKPESSPSNKFTTALQSIEKFHNDMDQNTMTKLKHKLYKEIQALEQMKIEEFGKGSDCNSSTMKSIGAMKSQIQIGLKKLSISKQLMENEPQMQTMCLMTKNRMKKTYDAIKKGNTHQEKSHKKKPSQSQVSFINGHSQSDSDHYHECQSREARSKRHTKSRQIVRDSSRSSDYDMAEGDDDSLCSCCKHERQRQTTVKSNHKPKMSWADYQRETTSEKKKMFNKKIVKQHTEKLHEKSRKIIESRMDKSSLIQNDKQREKSRDYDFSKMSKDKSRGNNKGKRDRTRDQNNERDKDKNTSTHHSQKRSSSRHNKSVTKEKRQLDSTPQSLKNRGANQFQQVNPWLTQQMMKNMANPYGQSFDASNAYWQQQLAFTQSLQQPQMIQSSFVPGQNFQMFLPNQQQILQNTNIQPPQIYPQTSASQNMSSQINQSLQLGKLAINSQTTHNLQQQLLQQQNQLNNLVQQQQNLLWQANNANQQPNNEQLQALESHKEQIEAIENLIRQAKSKLEQNLLTNKNQSCKFSDTNPVQQSQTSQSKFNFQYSKSSNLDIESRSNYIDERDRNMVVDKDKKKNSRNDKNVPLSSFNSNLEKSSQNNILFRTHNSNYSEKQIYDNESGKNANQMNSEAKFQRNLSHFQRDFMNQRRFSEQSDVNLDSKFGTNVKDTKKQLFKDQESSQPHLYAHQNYQESKPQGRGTSNIHNNGDINSHQKQSRKLNCQNQPDMLSSVLNQSISSITDTFKVNNTLGSTNTDSTPLNNIDKLYQQEQFEQKIMNWNRSERVNSNQYDEKNYQENERSQQNRGNRQKEQLNDDDTSTSKKDVLWIDFNEGESKKLKGRPQLKQQSQIKEVFQQQKKSSDNNNYQQNYPTSIPEEQDDDYLCSPDQQLPSSKNKNVIIIQHKPQPKLQNSKNQERQDSNQSSQQQLLQNKKQQQNIQSPPNKESWAMDFTEKTEIDSQSKSISDAFKNRLQSIEQRFKKQKDPIKDKKEFTKEELLERKKELLKVARQKIQQAANQHQDQENKPEASKSEDLLKSQDKNGNKDSKFKGGKNDNVPVHLLSRLSQGQKPEISKKEMLKLTSKNYEQLPEIKQRKLDDIKREELKQRLANVKELEKKRRQSVVNKRQAATTNNPSNKPVIKTNNVQQASKN